jgi:hypothetical protein
MESYSTYSHEFNLSPNEFVGILPCFLNVIDCLAWDEAAGGQTTNEEQNTMYLRYPIASYNYNSACSPPPNTTALSPSPLFLKQICQIKL